MKQLETNLLFRLLEGQSFFTKLNDKQGCFPSGENKQKTNKAVHKISMPALTSRTIRHPRSFKTS